MSDEDQSSKTEEPTEKKLRDARRKGDVPQSRETGTAMLVFALLMIAVFVAPGVGSDVAGALMAPIDLAGQIALGQGRTGVADTGQVMLGLSLSVARAMAPVIGIMLVAALVGVLIQGETVVSAERIRPKPEKLNPLSGFKRLFSTDAFVEFGKNMVKVLVIGVITLWVVRDLGMRLAQSGGLQPERLAPAALEAVRQIFLATTVFLVPVALGDILWKRFQWKKKQMMSLKDVRDETKDSEGDPQIRARRAEMRMMRARQRMAQAVPTASVVLTNPTHYAVALKYEQGQDDVPVCVAKGTDLMAARIRELAREHEIPIVENRPLARGLHDSVEVDQPVPFEHWQAVAEIIGFVMDLRRNVNRRPPAGSTLRDD